MLKRLLLGVLAFSSLAATVAADSTQTESSSSASGSATKTPDKSSSSTSKTDPSTTAAPTSSAVAGSGDAKSSSTASRTTNGPETFTVTVGAPLGTFAFYPNQIQNAQKGDTVLFEFFPSNHSVVKMDPSTPCIPYEYTNPGGASFYSGFKQSSVTELSHPPTWTLPINDSSTVWFYCSAPDSCIPHGMIGVINPPNDTIIDTVQAHAKQQAYALSPGDQVPNEDGSSPTSTSTPSSGKSSGLSGGAIAGIVIAAVAAFALIGLLFFFVGRRKKANEMKSVPSTGAGVDPYTDGSVAAAGMQSPHMQQFHQEHPPMYQQDARYSYVPPGSPGWPAAEATKHGHPGHLSQQSAVSSPDAMDQNQNRLSELASQNYDPVEMYTPGLPTSVENPNSPDAGLGQHTAEQKFEQHQRMMQNPSST
jgi:plastocyanin